MNRDSGSRIGLPVGLARRTFLRRAVGLSALAAATLTGSIARAQPGGPPTVSRPSAAPSGSGPSQTVAGPIPSVAATSSNREPTPPANPAKAVVSNAPESPDSTQPSAQTGAPIRVTNTRQPNVVLITIDTLRADRIGAYGFRSAQTPTLDRLAREGVRFDRAICQLPQTNPSHAALFTGLYSSTNGVKIHMVDKLRRLRPVRTVDASLNSSDSIERSIDGRADVTNAAVFNWLDLHASDDPFFLWIHYYDPHYPYSPPAGYDHVLGLKYGGQIDGSVDTIKAIAEGKLRLTDADRARLGELYQGEIAYVDAQIGRLFGELERRGILDDTVIALTGDHGESFGEHGDWTHGMKVFETEIRVPLLLRYPSRVPAGVTVAQPVQLVDVMPTLLELTGLRAKEPIQGTSLLPLIAGGDEDQSRVAFTELADEAFVSILTRTESSVTQELKARLHELMRISGVEK